MSRERRRAVLIGSAATLISLAVHGLVLLAIGGWYVKPVRPPRSTGVVPLDLVVVSRPSLVDVATIPQRGVAVKPTAHSSVSSEPVERAGLAPAEAYEQADTSANDARSKISGGFAPLDPRLYVDESSAPWMSPPPPPLDPTQPLESLPDILAEEHARELAERQITLFGQRITVFGDSLSYRTGGINANIAGRKQIMPMDGGYWENHELQRQRALAERDSILEERTKATRARIDGEREESH